jgi:hypothetical protein
MVIIFRESDESEYFRIRVFVIAGFLEFVECPEF